MTRSRTIRIIIGELTLEGSLDSTPLAEAISAALPLEGKLNGFGGELSFEIPVTHDGDEGGSNEVRVGTIAYWPPGRSLTLFFGETPLSTAESRKRGMVVATSLVSPVGAFEKSELLTEALAGQPIRVESV